MSDTQPLNIHDASNRFHDAHDELRRAAHAIIDSATIEELRDSAKVAEEMALARSWTADANFELARLNHQRWSTALARAERAERLLDATEDQVKDVGRSLNKAMDQCNTLGAEITTLRAQAATDAATIAELQASLAVMTNDRDHLMKSSPTATPPAAPDGAPRFKVGDKVAKVYGNHEAANTVTGFAADGRYLLKDSDGVPSAFRWSDDELMPFGADAANAQWAEKGGAQ